MFLSQMKLRKKYTITGYNACDMLKRRYNDLGFFVGCEIILIRKSLLKKTYLIDVMGIIVAIRNQTMNELIVEEVL